MTLDTEKMGQILKDEMKKNMQHIHRLRGQKKE